MKVLALIVCVAYLALLAQGLSDEEKQKIKTSYDECQSNPSTHLDKETLDKLKKGEEVDNDKLRAHSLCMTKKIGLQKENGDVDKEELKKILSKGISDDVKLNEAVDKCSTQKSTAGETAEELMRCIHKHVGHQIRDHGSHEHHD